MGNRGEYTIWLDDAMVLEKQGGKFPDPKDVVALVRSRVAPVGER